MISIRAAAMAMALVAAPALAGPLVVQAIWPSAGSYKPGSRLPDAPLVLKAGDTVTVLDAKGTRNFSGPGTFNIAAASQLASWPDLASLLVQKPERRARIGAVRGNGGGDAGPPRPPGVWAVDVGQTATVCALDPMAMSLWRADTSAEQTLTVKGANGATATVTFAASAPTAPLPVAVAGPGPLTITGGKAPVTLTVKKLDAAADVEALGAALAGAGCMNQFTRLATASMVK